MSYRKRIADSLLQDLLESCGSVLIEGVKWCGKTTTAEGAKSLNTLAAKIDTDKMKEPSFKMVLTGVGRYAYRRDDDVYVVPVGCLKN